MQISNISSSDIANSIGTKNNSSGFLSSNTDGTKFSDLVNSLGTKNSSSNSFASLEVTLSDEAQTLSNQPTTQSGDDDISSLMAWTPSFLQGRSEITDSEMDKWVAGWVQSANQGMSPMVDITDYINGGPMYYSGTRIPVTPESSAVDKQQSDSFVSELNGMYASEKAKGTSAMDIYIKIGQLILNQPNNFAYKFGYSKSFWEANDPSAIPAASDESSTDQQGIASIGSDADELSQAEGDFLQKSQSTNQENQFLLMEILYGKND